MSSQRGESAKRYPDTRNVGAPDDYSFTFNNQDGFTPLELGENAEYKIGEHIMWAPRKIRVGCIGAGAAGIMLCYKKEREFGDDIDLVVYERYPSPGGVWFANRYPGCRCDVPSAGYQFSFHPSPDWPRYYSSAEDICKYYCDFANSHNYVKKYMKLSHEVTRAEWNEQTSKWRLYITETFSSGERRELTDDVDFLVGNIGVLNTWKWPNVPNREAFEGQITHSANYDTSIDCKGKRVCVIGSGASSLQILPVVQKEASHVVSFYRTPQWVGPGLSVEGWTDDLGRNFTYTEEQKKRFRDDPKHYLEFRKAIENKINGSFRGNVKDHIFQQKGREMITKHMQGLLKNDPKLTKRLIPDFAMGCRRLGPGEGFLEALTAQNVTIADSDLESFTKQGLKCKDGTEYEVDIIICATGFDVSFRPYFPVIGKGGKSLAEEWNPTPEAYLAMAAHGFPNFMIGSLGPNCPAGHGSFVTVLESAQNYICKVIRKIQTENILSLDVKASVVREYNEHVHKWLQRRPVFLPQDFITKNL
ncbi:FAD/NAD(P)-binding domain-containing protein [Cadophora sp. DSE1049]|nr:FAD/NAD(P)-binding domain-containing protein [Cadophora sp. DSE1049]